MKEEYVDPIHKGTLIQLSDGFLDPKTGVIYPIINDIPRFCKLVNYSDTFGFQWSIFDRMQLDVWSGSQISETRFYATTGWKPEELSEAKVLEVGSGAGRFSEVILRTTNALLHSLDYSNAVEVNRKNNIRYGERLLLAQASIYEMPYARDSFDKVFCLGVLQHTPSFEKSVESLIKCTKVGGEVVVDFYPLKGWYTKIHSKYLLRPLTKRLPKSVLLKLIRFNINWLLRIFDFLCAHRLGDLTRFIPITDVRGFPSSLSPIQRREWAVMDTFDGLSPEYDNPRRVKDVEKMFLTYGCEVTFSGEISYIDGVSTVVRAKKLASFL